MSGGPYGPGGVLSDFLGGGGGGVPKVYSRRDPTEIDRGPPKLQTNSQADAIVSWAIFIFEENMFLCYTLSQVLQDNYDSMVWYGPPNGKVGVQLDKWVWWV